MTDERSEEASAPSASPTIRFNSAPARGRRASAYAEKPARRLRDMP